MTTVTATMMQGPHAWPIVGFPSRSIDGQTSNSPLASLRLARLVLPPFSCGCPPPAKHSPSGKALVYRVRAGETGGFKTEFGG